MTKAHIKRFFVFAHTRARGRRPHLPRGRAVLVIAIIMVVVKTIVIVKVIVIIIIIIIVIAVIVIVTSNRFY